MTRYFQETHPASFKRGTNDFARFYGMLIDGLQISYVQGFGYNQVLPAPDAEIPHRIQRAEQVFAQRLWREQLRDWDENCKPSAIAMHRQLQTIDPDNLSDTELVAYLTRCRDHHSAMIAQHMRFTAGAVPSTGDSSHMLGTDGACRRPKGGTDARFSSGVGRWLRRDGAPEESIQRGPFCPQDSRI
jgi:pyruvate,water dikinase